MTDRPVGSSSTPFRSEAPGRSPRGDSASGSAPPHNAMPSHAAVAKSSGGGSTSYRPTTQPMQIGIGVMLILVIVCAVISAGLVYAARIPEIQEELSVLFGTPVTADRSRRGPQILFILFTVTAPLQLAMALSLTTSLWSKFSNR
ncbi:hypothetical protein [Aporhodopirellula aestuarii]|uniref:Uncharacterized protein n=1 Tax=Aporhodopirellula aestuarii TaxID=2950107 RepID=A0ABT0U780_9BACT|nr:hypothetical protein [Aporhodopirellula aestuarii]MCM2372807.1 hypothetical protein [Aporhodopirellula aestuarii]